MRFHKTRSSQQHSTAPYRDGHNHMGKSQESHLFIGLQMCSMWQAVLEQTKDGLRHRGLHGLIWTPPERFHLTLQSLGETDERHFSHIGKIVEQVAAECEPFELQLGTLMVFGSSDQLTALCAGIWGEVEGLQDLRYQMQRALVPLNILVKRDQFKPHITVARPSDQLGEDVIRRVGSLDGRAIDSGGEPYVVRRVTLIHSTWETGNACHNRITNAVIGIEHGC